MFPNLTGREEILFPGPKVRENPPADAEGISVVCATIGRVDGYGMKHLLNPYGQERKDAFFDLERETAQLPTGVSCLRE